MKKMKKNGVWKKMELLRICRFVSSSVGESVTAVVCRFEWELKNGLGGKMDGLVQLVRASCKTDFVAELNWMARF